MYDASCAAWPTVELAPADFGRFVGARGVGADALASLAAVEEDARLRLQLETPE